MQHKRFGQGRKATMTSEEAEAIAAEALAFLASEEGRLIRFMRDTGLSPADLRSAAGSLPLAQAVLEYVLRDESLLLIFAAEARLDPARIAPAHALLEGGAG